MSSSNSEDRQLSLTTIRGSQAPKHRVWCGGDVGSADVSRLPWRGDLGLLHAFWMYVKLEPSVSTRKAYACLDITAGQHWLHFWH
jgi:hypothetical protein